MKFHKDGYTDLRGRFDYVSVNTPERQAIERFAVLVLDEQSGALPGIRGLFACGRWARPLTCLLSCRLLAWVTGRRQGFNGRTFIVACTRPSARPHRAGQTTPECGEDVGHVAHGRQSPSSRGHARHSPARAPLLEPRGSADVIVCVALLVAIFPTRRKKTSKPKTSKYNVVFISPPQPLSPEAGERGLLDGH